MTKEYKYYTTNTHLGGKELNKIKELGFKGFHNQFQIVCKAKSMAEANRIAESYGLYIKTFIKEYTSETKNIKQVEMADKYELIVCIDGTNGENYVGIKDLLG